MPTTALAGILRLAGALLPVVVLAAVAASAPVRAQGQAAGPERILSFSAEVTVRPDGVLQVEESLEVVAAGNEIRRGIFRDFPLRSLTPLGLNHIAGFEITRIERDGKAEPFFLEQLDAGVRIYLGQESVFLKPGRHRYTIAYETDRQLLHRPGEDELYWNVTGDAWAFPIERATVAVHLPDGMSATRIAAYTGPPGSRGSDVEILETGEGGVRLASARALAPGEGLTIAVVWPEGAIERPSEAQELLRLLGDNRGPLLGLVLLGILIVYFSVAWHRLGRDPQKGVVIPLFEPPKGLSPVAVGYIWNEGFGGAFGAGRALTVALTSLATKGALTIAEEAKGRFSLARAKAAGKDLPPGEKALFRTLFPEDSDDPVVIGRSYEPRMSKAKDALFRAFGWEYGRTYFRKNRLVWLGGALIALAAVLASLSLGAMSEGARLMVPVMMLFAAAFLAASLVLIGQVLARWFGAAAPGTLHATVLLLIAAACLLPVAGLTLIAAELVAPAALVPAGLSIAAAILFWFLLKAPTRLGRKTLDAIEGYRLYLGVAEADRLNAAGREPEITEALFEAHLPYAMALGVEEQWTAKAEARLAASTQDPSRPRARFRDPHWYRRHDTSRARPDSLASALSRNLGGAAASASTRPTSSGGASSSGSSGGGGGGGGGGGW